MTCRRAVGNFCLEIKDLSKWGPPPWGALRGTRAILLPVFEAILTSVWIHAWPSCLAIGDTLGGVAPASKGYHVMQSAGGMIYFLRHGESVANEQNVFAGIHNVPLTDFGRYQAEKSRQK